MEQYIIVYSKYIITLFMILYTVLSFFRVFCTETGRKKYDNLQSAFIFVIQFAAFLTICVEKGDVDYLFFYAMSQIAIFTAMMMFSMIYPGINRLLVNHMCLLLGTGFVILTRLDLHKAGKQLLISAVSLAVALAVPLFIRRCRFWKKLTWAYAGAGITAIGAVLILGQVTHGSKLFFSLGGITFQPSEFVKILFLFCMAAILWEDSSFKNVALSGAVAAAHILILVASRDLGSALIFFAAYVFLVFFATGKYRYLLVGAGTGGVASYLAFLIFRHVQVRVQAWKDPWSVIDNQGYQITQSLFAMSRGSWFGLGIGQGTPKDIPYVETDFIFAAVTEELGIIFSICLIFICISCFFMILKIALYSSDPFFRLIASGFGVMYIFQIFLTIGGGTKFIPLTGVTLPLVSYGGSSVMTTLILFSIMQGIWLREQDEWEKEDRRRRKAYDGSGVGEEPYEEDYIEEDYQDYSDMENDAVDDEYMEDGDYEEEGWNEDEYEEDDFEEDYRNGPEKEIYWDDEEEAPWNGRKNIRYPKGK